MYQTNSRNSASKQGYQTNYQTNLSDKFWGIRPQNKVIRQAYQTNLPDIFDANQAWKEAWWMQPNCGDSLGCAPIQQACSNLIQACSTWFRYYQALLRPASYYQACSGLMQPLNNQEAPGPMKFLGGGVGLPPTFALQEASAFNFQTLTTEKKPWTIIDPLSQTMETSTIHKHCYTTERWFQDPKLVAYSTIRSSRIGCFKPKLSPNIEASWDVYGWFPFKNNNIWTMQRHDDMEQHAMGQF